MAREQLRLKLEDSDILVFRVSVTMNSHMGA